MKRWALIDGGTVANVVEQDDAPQIGGDWRDITGLHVGPGFTLDGETYSPPAAIAPLRRVTRLAFRNRFTRDEKLAIEVASLDDLSTSMGQRQQAAALRVYLSDLAAATFIDLDRPDARSGVLQLETLGLLGAGRALQILDADIQANEIPQ
jgi:hypothetical protein